MKISIDLTIRHVGETDGDDQHSLAQLFRQGVQIMSAISDYVAKQNSFNAEMETAVQGIGADIKALNDKITALQNSPGTVTPEDQKLLDDAQAAGAALAAKFKALDALTPPTDPVPAPVDPI